MLSPRSLASLDNRRRLRVVKAHNPNDLIEDYLDHVCAPLVGIVPFEERSRLREEAGFHLERLTQSYVAEGLDPEAAARKAIRTYGDPTKISDDCIESYQDNLIQSRVFRRVGSANFVAFCLFGVAQVLYTALLQFRVFLPSGEAYRLPVSPAEARMLIPEPFPIPQSWAEFLLLYGFPIAAPLVAGFLTGLFVPVGGARAVFLAMMPIVIYSFVVGSFMTPITTGLLFGLFQAVYWIPAGCFASTLGATYGQRRAVRRLKLALFGEADVR